MRLVKAATKLQDICHLVNFNNIHNTCKMGPLRSSDNQGFKFEIWIIEGETTVIQLMKCLEGPSSTSEEVLEYFKHKH